MFGGGITLVRVAAYVRVCLASDIQAPAAL